jgi:hypothetical protein
MNASAAAAGAFFVRYRVGAQIPLKLREPEKRQRRRTAI